MHFQLSGKKFSGLSGKDTENINKQTSKLILPEEPTNCCMSGCANCVWIQYAEELSKIFRDGGGKTREMILSKIEDPNMKAYLSLELKSLEQLKK